MRLKWRCILLLHWKESKKLILFNTFCSSQLYDTSLPVNSAVNHPLNSSKVLLALVAPRHDERTSFYCHDRYRFSPPNSSCVYCAYPRTCQSNGSCLFASFRERTWNKLDCISETRNEQQSLQERVNVCRGHAVLTSKTVVTKCCKMFGDVNIHKSTVSA